MAIWLIGWLVWTAWASFCSHLVINWSSLSLLFFDIPFWKSEMERLWLDPEFTATEEGKRQLRDAILTMHRNDPGRITTMAVPMDEEQKTPNGCLQTSAGNCLLRRDMRYIKDQLRQLLEQHPPHEVKEPE